METPCIHTQDIVQDAVTKHVLGMGLWRDFGDTAIVWILFFILLFLFFKVLFEYCAIAHICVIPTLNPTLLVVK